MLSLALLMIVAAQDAPAADPVADKDEVICRMIEADTGTRLRGRKVCKTREEWKKSDKSAQDQVRRTRGNS